MSGLDADSIRSLIGSPTNAKLQRFETFAEIESTNTWLMGQPGPDPGFLNVAITDNQTAGRGRQGRSWQLPAGAGLALSVGYTFATSPGGLPSLTLAIGLGAISSLNDLGIAGIKLKWPNDLIARDGKLGGILTEAQTRAAGAVTVVTGVGLNVDVGDRLDLGAGSGWVQKVVDLRSCASAVPPPEMIAAGMIAGLHRTLADFEGSGFGPFIERWSAHDWLFGRELVVETAKQKFEGVGAGIGDDGALLIDTVGTGRQRVTSGSVLSAGRTGALR